jgi:hypothetical protein
MFHPLGSQWARFKDPIGTLLQRQKPVALDKRAAVRQPTSGHDVMITCCDVVSRCTWTMTLTRWDLRAST